MLAWSRITLVARLIAPTAVGVLLTGAAACLAVWALDAAAIKGWLDGLAADGSADEFPPARVAAMQWRALWAAAGAGLLAGGGTRGATGRGRDGVGGAGLGMVGKGDAADGTCAGEPHTFRLFGNCFQRDLGWRRPSPQLLSN